MSTPTTLIEYAAEELDRYEDRISQSREGREEARGEREAARTRLRGGIAEMADAQKEVDRLRSLLAKIPTPADGDALVEDLSEALVALRTATASTHGARHDLLEASLRYDRAQRDLNRAARRLAAAQKAMEEAESRLETRERWGALLDSPPLADVASTAEGLRTGSAYQEMAGALEERIPEGLRTSALRRRDLERARLDAAREIERFGEDRRNEVAAPFDPLQGPAAGPRTSYLRAWNTLSEHVNRSEETLSTAEAFLKGPVPEIPAPQAERLEELETEGDEAASREKAVTEARIELVEKETELDKARIAALADPEADPDDVADAEAARDTARDAVEAAEGEFSESHAETLERWQLALPDRVWRFFLRFHEVTESLERSEESDPDALTSVLEGAEATLAEALFEGARALGRRDALEERRRDDRERHHGLREAFRARVFSAVRGDSA